MKDMTTGRVGGHIVQLSTFIALSTFFQTLYFLADLYFVGRLGKEAIAGVALAGNLMFLVVALTQSLSVGATSLIAQALGRKDRRQAEVVFNQALVLSHVVGLSFGVVTFLLRNAYARWLAADAATAALGGRYLGREPVAAPARAGPPAPLRAAGRDRARRRRRRRSDGGGLMPRSGREIAAALRDFPGQETGDLAVLDALIADAMALEPGEDVDRALFGIFERFPDEDGNDVYWSIVHGLEGRGGYERGLLDSVRRAPSPFALVMLNRIFNDGQANCAGVSIASLLAEVASSRRASAEVRRQAAEFLEHQGGHG